MAKINLPEEVLSHDQDEIIEFLAAQARDVQGTFRSAVKLGKPDLLYTTLVDIELMATVLAALDRRNKEHTLK